jgi:LacI family transcriptional regulator
LLKSVFSFNVSSESKRVTLAEIAQRLGVTTATVSLALRNSPTISAETRRKVQEMAAEMGYRPDPRLSSLMSFLRTQREAPFRATLAYIHDFPEPDGHMKLSTHAAFFRGVKERAGALGYTVELFWVREPGMTAARLSKILSARGIPGALITTPCMSEWPLREPLEGLAVAVIGYTNWLYPCCRACNNQFRSMQTAIAELEARGYRRIGFAMHDLDDRDAAHAWLAAYLGHHHSLPASRRVKPLLGPRDEIFSEDRICEWIEKNKPDAIIGHTDPLVDRLRQLGFRMPEDIGFASLDLFERYDRLKCSGINQRSYHVGLNAVELVISQINYGENFIREIPRLVLVEGVWEEGVTTRPLEEAPARSKRPKRIESQ